jgi:hypothetical protein
MSSTSSQLRPASAPSSVLGRISLIAGLALVLAAAGTVPAGGSVLTGPKVVKVGAPGQSGAPAVALDTSGNAIVAWANTDDLHGANNFVQYCVLPVGATACTHKGSLKPPTRRPSSTMFRYLRTAPRS